MQWPLKAEVWQTIIALIKYRGKYGICGVKLSYESVRGAPGHVTNPGHLKMHHPGASPMLRCTTL